MDFYQAFRFETKIERNLMLAVLLISETVLCNVIKKIFYCKYLMPSNTPNSKGSLQLVC